MRTFLLSGALAVACCTAFGQTAEFEVASIKPSLLSNPNNGERNRRENITTDPGSLIMHNVSLKTALQWAYNVNTFQISGPGWLGDERYDITAKASNSALDPELRRMLQTLLTSRFKITLHHETKELQVFALTVGKNGPKMTPGDPNGQMKLLPGDGTKAMVTNISMDEIVEMLNRAGPQANITEPVIDQTGLKGRYNFSVDAGAFMQTVNATITAGKIPDADTLINAVEDVLQSQLGLKGDLRKAPVDLIVVERAEKVPTEN
jgi:uncharacterized protein (TIGR03435 family)